MLASDFQGNFTQEVHKVPNLCIGKWGVHNMIRALIPGLYDMHTRSPFLTQEDQTTFYEQGLLPAVQELCHNRSAEWPAKYTDEMFRARSRSGTLRFQSKMIPQWNVGQLGSAIRSKLRSAGIPWAKGIVFLHQIRGVKDSTFHSVDEDAAQQALKEFLLAEGLDLETIASSGKWWIDVGVQVTATNEDSLAWRTDSHPHIVLETCQVNQANAQRMTSVGSSQYARDMTSHLPQVSGCRIKPGIQGEGPYKVAYLQLYCTDKSITYLPDQGHFGKFITCSDVIKGKAKHFINQLYTLYLNAIDNNHAQARMELRVPVQFASSVLLNMNVDVICRALVSFPSVEWWYVDTHSQLQFYFLTTTRLRSLRAYRASAVQLVLGWQAEGAWQLRARSEALILTAGCVWLLNGLHSAPDNGPASRDLMDCILPQVARRGADEMFLAYGRAIDDDDDDDGDSSDNDFDARMTLPANLYGLVFFRTMCLGDRHPVPRFEKGKVLRDGPFRYLFGVDFKDITEDYFSSAVTTSKGPHRSNNRTRRTKRVHYDDDAPPQQLFHLRLRGVELEQRPHDDGSDLEAGEEEEDLQGDVDKRLTNLWLQFLRDVASKAANRKGGDAEGYCKFTGDVEVALRDRGLYKNLRLSEFFNDCQWRVGVDKDWDAVFDHLFPLDSRSPRQNYNSCTYYRDWKDIRDSTPDRETLDVVRKALKSKFSTLLWFPYAQGDRIWPTRLYESRFKKFIKAGEPAPWILCRRQPSWN
jgi:hypothetical protein